MEAATINFYVVIILYLKSEYWKDMLSFVLRVLSAYLAPFEYLQHCDPGVEFRLKPDLNLMLLYLLSVQKLKLIFKRFLQHSILF